MGDDDGLLVASAAELRALIPAAREVEARELKVRRLMAAGRSLTSMLSLAEHVEALQRGVASKLTFKLDE
jgi:regulator of RNase E activity RraA